MAQATGTIEILDPTAEDVPEEVGLNDALPDLKGKVVGLLENRKYHADAFLGELKEVLLNDYGAAKIVYATSSRIAPLAPMRRFSLYQTNAMW